MPTKILTKADEIALIREFVVSLPEVSYLRSALEPFAEEFERDIYSDLIPQVRDSWNARIEADRETKAAREELRSVQAEIRKARLEATIESARILRLRDAFQSIRTSAGAGERAINEIVESLK
jgi:hypothetical protein